MQLKALAKINLGLDVLRKREDGYHEVRMIMQSIHMYDRITLEQCDGDDIRVKTNLAYLPTNENNLVYKAAKVLKDEFEISDGISIDLQKFIPVAAGMAGGSSDAAAVLFGMNQMFGLKLSVEQLMERGVKLGADIPYCIMRGTALAEGIGEKLTALPPMPKCYILILKPGISVSTKFVYENLHANALKSHPDVDGMLAALEAGDLKALTTCMQDGNVLETVTATAYPVIEDIKKKVRDMGALVSLMSGSGPTVFGIFDNEELAKKAYAKMRRSPMVKQCYLTTPYNNRRNSS